jgi:hypothetical protein
MKLIFLDIDGVLVTTKSLMAGNEYRFDKECIKNLLEIITVTEAKIVISSSWREDRTLIQLQKLFEKNGLGNNIIDVTPIHGEHEIRGSEIKAFLEKCDLEIERFVIIDDDEEMGELAPFLVETNFKSGIDESVKKQVLEMLNS